MKFPIRYVPKKLSRKDKKKQVNMIIKSKKLYKKHKYYTRKNIKSYKNKKSNHIYLLSGFIIGLFLSLLIIVIIPDKKIK